MCYIAPICTQLILFSVGSTENCNGDIQRKEKNKERERKREKNNVRDRGREGGGIEEERGGIEKERETA